ncbi:1D-myo-inositol 2-acetamido-2-deoxy-alpha-D-glucopyranoside deacetylase [Streptomyces californicus]
MTGVLDGGHADPIQAPGTPEAAWQAWPGWQDLPEAALDSVGRVVVVAAHPDDEVLGFGGALALLAASGTEVTVVAVTDGEGSHPDSDLVTAPELVRLGTAETRAALAELGAAEHRDRRTPADPGHAGGGVRGRGRARIASAPPLAASSGSP